MHKTQMLVFAVSLTLSSIANAQTPAEVQLFDVSYAQYEQLQAIPLPLRGMVSETQEISIVINNAKLKDVYDIYSNVYNAQGSQPFLTGLTAVRHTNKTFDFIAYENIPLPDGSIVPLATVARQKFKRAKSYHVDTFSPAFGIITHQDIIFTKISKWSTRVTEVLTFEAVPSLITLAVQGGVFAHMGTQASLKSKIEAGQLQPIKFPKYLPGAANEECDEDDDD